MCLTLVWMLTAVWQMTVAHQIAALTPYQPWKLETLQAIWVPARVVAHQMKVATAQQSQPEKTPRSQAQTVHRRHPQGKPVHPVLRQLNQPASQADHLHHHQLTTQWQWGNSTESKQDMPPLSQSTGKEINRPDIGQLYSKKYHNMNVTSCQESRMSPNQDQDQDLPVVLVVMQEASTETDWDYPVMKRNDHPRRGAIPGLNKL